MVQRIGFIDDPSDLYDPYPHQEQMEDRENKTMNTANPIHYA
jgi:hypothetical protein